MSRWSRSTPSTGKGKRKRHRKKPSFGKRPDTKRAIVTLAEGDRIPLFES